MLGRVREKRKGQRRNVPERKTSFEVEKRLLTELNKWMMAQGQVSKCCSWELEVFGMEAASVSERGIQSRRLQDERVEASKAGAGFAV
jgi:hypothetical protein